MSTNTTMTPAEWAMLCLLSLLWGGSFFFAKVAVGELDPLVLVLARVGLAALALWLVMLARRERVPTDGRTLAGLAVMGLLGSALPFSLIFWSQTHITSGLAATLNAATPLGTALLAHVWGREERLTAHRAVGVLVGIAGVALLVGASASTSDPLAPLGCIGAALSYSVSAIFARKHLKGIPPLVLATGQMTTAGLMMLPVLTFAPLPESLTWTTIGSVIGLGLLSTAFAFLLFFRLLATAGATNVQLVTFLIPVSAILLGVLVLGESLTLRHMAGMGVIAVGLVLLDGRLLARLRAKEA